MSMMVTMNLFFYIAFVFVTSVFSDEVDEFCTKMFDSELIDEDCCETDFERFEDMDESIEGCAMDDSDDPVAQCEYMTCYLKSEGIWKNDEIDNEAAKKRLENMEFKEPKNKKTAQKVIKKCLDGKYLNYGTEELCPAMKYVICNYINTVVECDSWKKTEQCSKISEFATKCKVLLDSDN